MEKNLQGGDGSKRRRGELWEEREKVCLDEKEMDEKVINLKGEAWIFVSDLKKKRRIISLQITHRLGCPWECAK